MEGLLRDIRYSLRSLRKRPVFSLLVVLMLAVAIAANSSIQYRECCDSAAFVFQGTRSVGMDLGNTENCQSRVLLDS